MNRQDQDQLLSQVLGGEHLEALRQGTLAHGLNALRRRRQRRRFGQACALLCLPLLTVVVLLHFKNPPPLKKIATSQPPSRSSPVKVISDEELFALFPDRAVALVGKAGHQQFVFLDRPGATGN